MQNFPKEGSICNLAQFCRSGFLKCFNTLHRTFIFGKNILKGDNVFFDHYHILCRRDLLLKIQLQMLRQARAFQLQISHFNKDEEGINYPCCAFKDEPEYNFKSVSVGFLI